MRSFLKAVLIAVLVGLAVWAALAWPHVSLVETGRTPEYPDLQPREYAAGVVEVSRAARAAVDDLPGWTWDGGGSGPGGSEIKAIAKAARFVPYDVTVRIRRERGRTVVSVRSQSRSGPWDLGQNARNVRAFLSALDQKVRQGPGRGIN